VATERLIRRLTQLYEAAELAILSAMAVQLSRASEGEDFPASAVAGLGAVALAARRIVKRLGRDREGEVMAVLAESHRLRSEAAASVLRTAPQRVVGTIEATLARVDSEAATRALANALAGRLAETDLRVLRAADDIYRRVIAEVTAQGLAGKATRRTAAQAALDRLVGHGITGFVDSSGRNWSLASYVEMATRTAVHNAERQGVIDGTRAAGRDLVMISGSPACCDLCAPWEGQVVSLDGMTTGYPTLSDAEADGVFHPGCRHTVAPYVEGLTRADYYQQGDPERYAAEQQQRYLERGLRQWKRREALALDPTQAQLAQNKIGEWRRRLEEHVTKHDLPREREREQISKAI